MECEPPRGAQPPAIWTSVDGGHGGQHHGHEVTSHAIVLWGSGGRAAGRGRAVHAVLRDPHVNHGAWNMPIKLGAAALAYPCSARRRCPRESARRRALIHSRQPLSQDLR